MGNGVLVRLRLSGQDLRLSSQRDKSLKSESLEVGKGGLPPLTLGLSQDRGQSKVSGQTCEAR